VLSLLGLLHAKIFSTRTIRLFSLANRQRHRAKVLDVLHFDAVTICQRAG
jgi:hypothetical protein